MSCWFYSQDGWYQHARIVKIPHQNNSKHIQLSNDMFKVSLTNNCLNLLLSMASQLKSRRLHVARGPALDLRLSHIKFGCFCVAENNLYTVSYYSIHTMVCGDRSHLKVMPPSSLQAKAAMTGFSSERPYLEDAMTCLLSLLWLNLAHFFPQGTQVQSAMSYHWLHPEPGRWINAAKIYEAHHHPGVQTAFAFRTASL